MNPKPARSRYRSTGTTHRGIPIIIMLKPYLALLRGSLIAAFIAILALSGLVARADDLGRTDVNGGLFPDSSIVDFSYLLDAPAGKNGFLTVDSNGHFAWPSGDRARFWGVNISNRSVWVPQEVVDKVVDVLARAGVNMVRF